MDKKVDTALMGGQKNDMSGRAPLAPGYDELKEGKPGAADALSKAVTKTMPDVPYDELNTEGRPKGMAINKSAASSALDPAMPAIAEAAGELSEVEVLKLELDKLTKRLEDFGAIPQEADLTPREPVVTITKSGNKRTDF